MRLADFIQRVLANNDRALLQALDGLTTEELKRQPKEGANPVGWLFWHVVRAQDRIVAAITGTEQVWITERWYERFGRDRDPDDRGAGHTLAQVKAFSFPDRELLEAYFNRVIQARRVLSDQLEESTLERMVPDVEGTGQVPLWVRLEGLLVESLQHAGQIAYLRGMLREPGWLGR